MKRTLNIFYILTGIYIIVSIVFIVARDRFFDSMGIVSYTNFLQFWLILGIVFLVTIIIISQVQLRRLHSRNRFLEGEVANIKSKLYDMEHRDDRSNIQNKPVIEPLKPNKNNPDFDSGF